MPCRDGGPSRGEQEISQRHKDVCCNLAYLLSSLEKQISPEILEGCRGTYVRKSTLDKYTDLLCQTCSNLTLKEQNQWMYDGRNPKARKLADWWEKHQETDHKRIAKETEKKKIANIRKKALSKLSPEEISALGIKP